MRIMLAASDRGLLAAYRAILEQDVGTTVTAFDGTQVVRLAESEDFDLAILDRRLPRVDMNELTRLFEKKGVPVVALWDEPITASVLTNEAPVCSYLAYPFTPEELVGRVRNVLEKRSADGRLRLPGLDVSVAGFALPGGTPLTAEEMDTLLALHDGTRLTADKSGVYFSAINRKFAREGLDLRIVFEPGQGFRLVVGKFEKG